MPGINESRRPSKPPTKETSFFFSLFYIISILHLLCIMRKLCGVKRKVYKRNYLIDRRDGHFRAWKDSVKNVELSIQIPFIWVLVFPWNFVCRESWSNSRLDSRTTTGQAFLGFQLASVPQMGQGCCHNNSTVVGPLYLSCVEQETSLIPIDPPAQHMLSLYSYKICRTEHKLPFIFSWHIFSVCICSPVFISLYSYRRPAMLWRYYVTPFFPSLSLSSGSASQTVWDCLQSGRDLLVIIT